MSTAAGGTQPALTTNTSLQSLPLPETQRPTPAAPCPPCCDLQPLHGRDKAQSPQPHPLDPTARGVLANWFLSAGTGPAPREPGSPPGAATLCAGDTSRPLRRNQIGAWPSELGEGRDQHVPCITSWETHPDTPGMRSQGPLGPQLCSSRSWAVVLALAAGRPRQSQAPAL